MDDTAEVIRHQMDETKSQLSDKLESLEHQVSETVHTTGTAVNATVGAVQETVETVTDAMQDAVRALHNAFDIQRQIHRHPWLILGGSVVVGYLAAELLRGSAKKKLERLSESAPCPLPPTDNVVQGSGKPAVECAATTAAAIAAAHEAGLQSSSRSQLRGMAIGALIGIVQDVASHVVPHVMNYFFTGARSSTGTNRSTGPSEPRNPPGRQATSEVDQHRQSVANGSVTSGKSF